jgi:hypothetical protein
MNNEQLARVAMSNPNATDMEKELAYRIHMLLHWMDDAKDLMELYTTCYELPEQISYTIN